MTTIPDLIAELRGFAAGSESARASLMRDAADALEAQHNTIERIRALEPTWPRGMYGAPDDMYGGRHLRRILTDALKETP